ncbi:hypothetical protein AOQ84DRAFT_394277 [Glonium stellatum]|uniref:Uncharacterized protein n=1 Tax=Glonium stellatum TaxID=574774 RepID=A0A8E2FD04_9PEZI|nr:hypothetical protein AOQ84DRAFT_394277 [Glonium stellatum]
MPPEAARERDLYRYYQPWLDAQSLVDARSGDHGEAWGLTYQGYRPRSSRDKALTSWAQLATLRLNVRRGMVSLIDSSQQYILAEATKTLSLISESRYKPGDEVWLGNTIIARDDGVCHHTFASLYTAVENDGSSYTTEALVVPDLRLDDRFKQRDYVTGNPGVLFYAGVPIKTKSGHKIGVYAVSSDQPRFGLDIDELKFMEDVAATVMEHLEMAKDRDDRNKGERMVRGLAEFIEGMSSMEASSLATTGATNQSGRASVPEINGPSRISAVMERQTENARLQILDQTESPMPNYTSDSPQREPAQPTSAKQQLPPELDDSSHIFARAAQIIRESTSADGVVFFGTMASNLRGHFHELPGNADEATDESPDHTSGSENVSAGSVPGRRRRRRENSSTSQEANKAISEYDINTPQKKACELVGFSISDETFSKSRLSYKDFALSEESMERYIRRFPYGKFFSFTDEGSGISSGDESVGNRFEGAKSNTTEVPGQKRLNSIKKSKKEPFVPTELLKVLPGVRNLIFLPLWDFTEGKYIAGGFIWTDRAGRLMSPDNELPYLKAFGNSIMSEIARTNAQKADLAKTTFIASISHELRSPLHGILGSVEFLHDTATSAYQSGLFNSIETCGKTLLDTIEHVLDYAKINKLRKANVRKKNGAMQARRKSNANSNNSNNIMGLAADFDLAALVEEVTDAVCAGHAFKRAHPGTFQDPDATIEQSEPASSPSRQIVNGSASRISQNQEHKVAVLLDIEPRPNWTVRAQPGALRRIVMNLLGNALKYTSSGFVSVALQSEADSDQSSINVRLRFVDSGKGMSMEYQRTRLFSPFSQEDPFSAGTGLGLSIVRQITDSLGGSIHIKSTQYVGTDVEVLLKLPASDLPIVSQSSQTALSVASATKGLKLCLLDPILEGEASYSENLHRIEESLQWTCKNWFGMEIFRCSDTADIDPDIFLYAEPPPAEAFLNRHGGDVLKATDKKDVPIIVICTNASRALEFRSNEGRKMGARGILTEAIPQPCGPRKLAKVLQKCLDRISSMSDMTAAKMRPLLNKNVSASAVTTQPSSKSLNLGMEAASFTTPHRNTDTSECLAVCAPDSPLSKSHLALMNRSVEQGQASQIEHLRTSSVPAVQSSHEATNVLVVDDNPINLQLLVMFMKKHKFSYAEARNGLEALEKYKASCTASNHYSLSSTLRARFDYVLMDISMPVMDGLESTRLIRKFELEHQIKATTIIALTGLASAQAQHEALNSGVNHYLPKPVKFQELRYLLDR